jgi:hypothetical protein
MGTRSFSWNYNRKNFDGTDLERSKFSAIKLPLVVKEIWSNGIMYISKLGPP